MELSAMEELITTKTKICKDCGIDKKLTDFSKDFVKKDKLKTYCKKCAAIRFKMWREKNIEEILLKDRIKHYIRKYGISKEKALELVDNRIGKCEICFNEKPLVVDHQHDTGNIRGMICSSCNSMIGYSKENIQNLYSCIEYLRKYNG